MELPQSKIETIKLLGSVDCDNTYSSSCRTRNTHQYPLLKKILRNRFEITQVLGSGGSGDTYLAVDLDLPGKPHCVVKHFKPKDSNPAVVPIAKSLFTREAEALYQLGNNHDQIPTLFAHFDEDGDFYLVQRFVDGYDLTQEIIVGKSLSENAVFNLLKDILEVLAFVHQHNIIHRDIKPQNIMRRHSDGKVVLIDFGSIKKLGALGANVTIAVGTPGYMPSEQAKGKPKLCSDVYAVGMIGIQALTGLQPNQLQEDPDTEEIIWRHKAQVSDALADVIDLMVRDRHSQRYQSATEALQALLSTKLPPSVTIAEPNQNADHKSLPLFRNFFLLLGMGLGVTTSLVILVLFYAFLNANTSLPDQPTKFNRLMDIPTNKSSDQKEVCKNNCTIEENTKSQIYPHPVKKSQ